MKQKTYFTAAGVIFLVVAAVHAWRLSMGGDVTIGQTEVPMWASWVAVLVGGYMSYVGLKNKA